MLQWLSQTVIHHHPYVTQAEIFMLAFAWSQCPAPDVPSSRLSLFPCCLPAWAQMPWLDFAVCVTWLLCLFQDLHFAGRSNWSPVLRQLHQEFKQRQKYKTTALCVGRLVPDREFCLILCTSLANILPSWILNLGETFYQEKKQRERDMER